MYRPLDCLAHVSGSSKRVNFLLARAAGIECKHSEEICSRSITAEIVGVSCQGHEIPLNTAPRDTTCFWQGSFHHI